MLKYSILNILLKQSRKTVRLPSIITYTFSIVKIMNGLKQLYITITKLTTNIENTNNTTFTIILANWWASTISITLFSITSLTLKTYTLYKYSWKQSISVVSTWIIITICNLWKKNQLIRWLPKIYWYFLEDKLRMFTEWCQKIWSSWSMISFLSQTPNGRIESGTCVHLSMVVSYVTMETAWFAKKITFCQAICAFTVTIPI